MQASKPQRFFFLYVLASICASFTVQASVCLAAHKSTAFVLPVPPGEADQAALRGKLTIEKLIQEDKELAPFLGFRSADEATEAKMSLGPVLPVVSIPIERLKTYSGGHDVTTLLHTDQFIYPVTVGGKIRSAITVKKPKSPGPWNIAFGALAAPLAAAQLNILGSAFLVRLPAMDRWFLGTVSGNEVIMFAISTDPKDKGSDPTRSISIGKQENARDTFAKLAEEAKKSNYRALSIKKHFRHQ